MCYAAFDAHALKDIRKKLISEKGSDLQREFLAAVRTADEFEKWMEGKNLLNKQQTTEGKGLPPLPQKLTEAEFKDPPKEIEELAYDAWKEIPPKTACDSPFWGWITYEQIENGIIEPHYLATNGKSDQVGLARIETALVSGEAKGIDDVVRTILRNFSGLPEARGGLRTIYVDCPFSRAWWRERFIRQVVDESNADNGKVSSVLRKSKAYWEQIMSMILQRNTVLGDEKVRTALICVLSEIQDDERYQRLFHNKEVTKCIKLIGINSAWRELGVSEIDELKEFIKEEIFDLIISQSA